jgi:hypothetical protein
VSAEGEATVLKGSCLCQGVKYQAEGPIVAVARCHCEQCRKASGSEFASNGSVPATSFHVLQGEELLEQFEWSPGEARVFCRRCGSPLFKRSAKNPNMVRLRLGALDVEIDVKPTMHVFVSEKPGWSEITDALPQYEKSVPPKSQ